MSTLVEDIKNNILTLLNNNLLIDNSIDIINFVLNKLFDKSKDERDFFIKLSFVFLMFYTEFINNELEEETKKIYRYINYSELYKINYKIIDSIYVLIASLIESDIKDNSNNFLVTFDTVISNNIKKYQKNKSIDYDPYKTPIIKEVLTIFEPVFDSINLYDKLN